MNITLVRGWFIIFFSALFLSIILKWIGTPNLIVSIVSVIFLVNGWFYLLITAKIEEIKKILKEKTKR